MTDTNQSIVIRNEQDAFRYLERALAHEVSDLPLTLTFEAWPVLEIRMEGPGYAGTITADMAEGLVELQHAMDRAFARTVHHSATTRILTHDERRHVSFKAKVEEGSSLIKVDIGEFAEKLALSVADKMTPEQMILAIVGVAAVAGSVVAYKAFLNARTSDKKIDAETRQRIALSQEETLRLATLARAYTASPSLDYLRQDFDAARVEIVKGTGDADTLSVSGVVLDRESARVVAMTKRSESKDVQLNGSYLIKKTDWQHDGEIRLVVCNADTARIFNASFRDQSLDQAQLKLLQAAEWSRGKVYLSINATELRGEVTTATIVSAQEQPDTAAA